MKKCGSCMYMVENEVQSQGPTQGTCHLDPPVNAAGAFPPVTSATVGCSHHAAVEA